MIKRVQDYLIEQVINLGTHGKVYLATKNKKKYSIKMIPILMFPKIEEYILKQIETLLSLPSNKRIVKYYETISTNNNYYFVYQYCNGGTLRQLLEKQGKLSQQKALNIYKQIVNAFKILNNSTISYKDLSPNNILFHNGQIKLGEFGLYQSAKIQDLTITMSHSPIYTAPQVLKGQVYDSKSDIWSLGVILFQILFGFCPFQSHSLGTLISNKQQIQLVFPLQFDLISQQTQHLLGRLLTKQREDRINWDQLFAQVKQENQINQYQQYSFQKVQEKQQIQQISNKKQFLSLSFKQQKGVRQLFPFYYKNQMLEQKQKNIIKERKKNIVQEHSFCLKALKTSFDFLKSDCKQNTIFSYLILNKCQLRYKNMIQDCKDQNISEDLTILLDQELIFIQTLIADTEQDLRKQQFEFGKFLDCKKLIETNWDDKYINLWFQLVNFLFGKVYQNPKKYSQIELFQQIKKRLI